MEVTKTSIDYEQYGQDQYRLKKAIYLYERYSTDSVCIMHSVKQNGTLGLGSPVDGESLSALFSNSSSQSRLELIPDSLLVNSSQIAVWWSKAQSRRIFFRVSDRPIILNVTYPALLWKVNKAKRTLHLVTIPNKRPSLDTSIYHAPLMNIDGYGFVCLGSAKLPELNIINQDTIERVEACIFESNFTHVNHDKTLKSSKRVTNQMQIKYWRTKSKAGKGPKLSELSKCGKVKEFIYGVNSI